MKHGIKIFSGLCLLFAFIACEDTRPTVGTIYGSIECSDTIDLESFLNAGLYCSHPKDGSTEILLDENLEFSLSDLPFGVYVFRSRSVYSLVPLQEAVLLTQDDAIKTVVYGVAQAK